jgi:hypothetical protein
MMLGQSTRFLQDKRFPFQMVCDLWINLSEGFIWP